MSKFNRRLLAVTLANILATGSAFATNGYFSDGTGAKNRGMGGAGTAVAQEAGSMVLNPAAAVNMDPQMAIGFGIFSPKPRSYRIQGNDIGLNNSAESESNYFGIPFYGQNFAIDAVSSWGVTVTALGGMNTNFKTNPFDALHPSGGSFGALGVDLKQINVSGVYAREVNPGLSVGVALGIVYQTFEARGLGPFAGFSLTPSAVTNNGHDTSTGIALKLGASYEINKDMTIGFAYSPETDMDEFSKYRGLFAEGGDFDIPSSYNLGFAWQATPEVLFAIDYVKINYTDVASISNDAQRLTDGSCDANPFAMVPATSSSCLGGANGAGFGWDDVDVIKLGFAFEASADLTYRAGWNHGDNPIKSEDAVINIIAPGVVEDHLTLGMTMKLDATSELSFDFIHSFENSVTGDVPAAFSQQNPSFGGNPSGTPGTATISMEQNFIEVQYGKRF